MELLPGAVGRDMSVCCTPLSPSLLRHLLKGEGGVRQNGRKALAGGHLAARAAPPAEVNLRVLNTVILLTLPPDSH